MRLRNLLLITLAPLLLAAWAGHVFLGDKKQDPAALALLAYQHQVEAARAKAATGDYAEFTVLGNLLRKAPEPLRNPAEALSWLRKAADKGYPPAQVAVGEMYEAGDGVKRDYHRAAEWYGLATRLSKDATAHFRLAELYFRGQGVPQDFSRALSHCGVAAAQGNPVAQYLLGTMTESGWGIERDPIAAYVYYSLAAERADRVKAYRAEFDPFAARQRLVAGMNKSQIEVAEKHLAAARAAAPAARPGNS